ncbi:DUF6602 domain-containing protein [Lewinella sp. W8]|uniref:DUF6602 domain-containing protein n=1 Tax=Lewinella sp. W8 TaxID=2528208 RepID=UPI001067630C|nr:DUF6602 domain-containing protein [Lewinella sp. W8]MTB52785.1 hypothetical protein [Lewinella sp. W8]
MTINTDDWIPRRSNNPTFNEILFQKCKRIDSELIQFVENETKFNLHNFDTGLEIENQVAKYLEDILPKRYCIGKGIVCDRSGQNSGENDIVIFNEYWFPKLTGGRKNDSIKSFYPIEGVFALGEIKQTLTPKTLIDAYEKLVISSRLSRPTTSDSRISENRTLGKGIGTSNPLFKFIVAINLDDKYTVDDMYTDFVKISQDVGRSNCVNFIGVISSHSIHWVTDSDINANKDNAKFNDLENHKIYYPALRPVRQASSCFYDLLLLLYNSMNNSILGSEDIVVAYGNQNGDLQIPDSDEYYILPIE